MLGYLFLIYRLVVILAIRHKRILDYISALYPLQNGTTIISHLQEQSMVNIYLDGVHIYLSNYDVRSIYLVYFHPTKA